MCVDNGVDGAGFHGKHPVVVVVAEVLYFPSQLLRFGVEARIAMSRPW